jgi:SAM-dependent methyltransferase
MYNDLAWTWPIISPPEDYVEEAELIAGLVNEFSKTKAGSMLNLGCGGGHEDFSLKKYFQVTGVDLSENMLELSRRLNPENTYHRDDLRSVRLDGQFDSVIATSLMYMKNKEDLRSAFQTAYEHLKPNGVFVALAEKTVENFEQNKTYCSTHNSGEIEIVYVENHYDPDTSDTTFELTMIYLIRRNGVLEIQKDHHLCGIFSLDTWIELLNEIGFDVTIKNVKLKVTQERETFSMLVCVKQ